MPQNLSALPVGALVRDTNTRYFGQTITWRVAARNHPGYPANSTTLIADRIIALKAFDGNEPNNADANRRTSGNNRYLHSNLRQWLNSEAAANAWYTAQHAHDEPPSAARVWTSHNPYQAIAGFVSGFSADMRAALLPTLLTVARNTVTDGGGSETVTDRIFLASNTEVGLANENNIAEGSRLALFSNDASRLSIPTPQCVSNSTWQGTGFNSTAAWHWWLRTPSASHSRSVRLVSTSGVLANAHAFHGTSGVRPLCNLSSEILVSSTPDADGAYTIIWIPPPTPPDGIQTPENLVSGRTATITWGLSTAPLSTIGGYILDRAANGGAWTEIYRGIARNHADTISTQWTTVQYRVRAFNNHGIEGANTTSPALNVIHNNDPVINGSDSDLGLRTGAFNQTYTVTNPDAHITKTLTVVERINGREKRTFTATSGATNTFSVTAEEWRELLNGTHTLTITATDNFGGTATRTFTFSKNETEIEITLSTPLNADDAVTRAIMNITRQIPVGAAFTVEVCNNAFDASPTWEDVTQAVVSGNRFFLQNETRTADRWGFNIRVRVSRNTAQGDIFIQGIGGNFE